jgi:hypothetical protein
MNKRTISQAASLTFVKRAIIAMLVPACIFQCLLGIHDLDRFLSVFYCVAGSFLLLTVFSRKPMAKNPLSSLLVMGFGFTHFFLPIVFTSIMGRSVTYRMSIPHVVFGWALVTFGFLVLFHKVYCYAGLIHGARSKFQKGFLAPLGLFTPPKTSQLWIMGVLGLIAMFLAVRGGEDGKVPGILMKVIDGFRPFSFAPFMLLVQPVWGPRKKLEFGNSLGLVCFAAIMFFFAMASGSRGYAIFGFVNAVLIYFLGLCIGTFPKPKVRPASLAVGILCLILWPLFIRAFKVAQVSVTRDSTIPLTERFDQFWQTFQKSESVKGYHELAEEQTLKYGLWDEDYTGNEFLNRLANPRTHDNLMSSVYELSEADRSAIRHFDYRRALSTLPAPFLRALGLSINKEETLGGSLADYIWMLRKQNPWTFGEFKMGSFMASTYCYVGSFFPLLIAALALPVLFLSDLLAFRVRSAPDEFKTVIPLIGCLQGYALFAMLSTNTTMESPSALLGAVTRGYLQVMVLYLVVFHLTALNQQRLTKRACVSGKRSQTLEEDGASTFMETKREVRTIEGTPSKLP